MARFLEAILNIVHATGAGGIVCIRNFSHGLWWCNYVFVVNHFPAINGGGLGADQLRISLAPRPASPTGYLVAGNGGAIPITRSIYILINRINSF
jgi:hypothetical protein